MPENQPNTINALADGLDELTIQCFKIVRDLCGGKLSLIVAVCHEMAEIARVNNVILIGDTITAAAKERKQKIEDLSGVAQR